MAASAHANTPATAALVKAGIEFRVHTYHHDASAHSFGEEAADALGADPRAVCKTLMVRVDTTIVVAVVPVSGNLDLKALAAAVGGKRAELVDAPSAQRATGYVVGGISPLGQARPHPTVIDSSVLDLPAVFVSGGKRGMSLEMAPSDLVALTHAITAPIGRA